MKRIKLECKPPNYKLVLVLTSLILGVATIASFELAKISNWATP